jgi:hypothetical protein
VQHVIAACRAPGTGFVRAIGCALALAFAGLGLGGCASTGAVAGTAGDAALARADVPQLRLAPAALGRPLALQQRISVQAPGHAQQLDVLLEADAAHVQLAVLAMGQVAARLDWDGTKLEETRAPWWPPQVSGGRILSDLQLAMWPADAIAAALPAGWRVSEEEGVRTLRNGDEIVTTVRRLADDTVEIAQRRAHYTLTIASQPLEPAAADAEAGARR